MDVLPLLGQLTPRPGSAQIGKEGGPVGRNRSITSYAAMPRGFCRPRPSRPAPLKMRSAVHNTSMRPSMLKLPGTWIAMPKDHVAHEIGSHFLMLREALEEAALVLDMFNDARKAITDRNDSASPDWHRELRMMRIHARSFLFLSDRVVATARCISEDAGNGKARDDAIKTLEASVPALRHVRNSSAHVEDRMRRRGPGKTSIKPKPLLEGPIYAPQGEVMLIENLNGTRFGGTLADGSHGEIDVTAATLNHLVAGAQALAATFQWTGPPAG